MRSGAHLQLEDVCNVTDERALKVLLECFKHDQLLSHRLQLPITLWGKKREHHGIEQHEWLWLQINIAQHTGK